MRKPICIRVDDEIWKTAKRFALDIDLTLGELVESSLLHEMRGKINQ